MHLRLKGLSAAVAAAAVTAVAVALVLAPAAGAAITASHITTPADNSYFVNDYSTGGQSITISGTTTGAAAGDKVDINCYHGGTSSTIASNVPVNQDGSFSVSVPLGGFRDEECILRAVPAGTTPTDVTPFAGPRVGVGEWDVYTNGTTPYDFYAWGQQSKGAFDYLSLGSCGVTDGYLFDPTLALTTTTFWCNAYLWQSAGIANRSQLQVDGANAYTPYGAKRINQNATGLPALTSSYSLDKKTGDLVIHETDPIVKCTDATYPPTTVSCASFVSAGVVDHRTIEQNSNGLVAWVTDVFSSTNGKSHKLDLLWENDNRFHGSTGNSAQLEFRFPGQKSYSTHIVGDNVSLPAKPGTILIRMQGAADGDTSTGQGAIVYDRAAKGAQFTYENTYDSTFELHQTATVPAKGKGTRFRFAYVQGYKLSDVTALAKVAAATFKGCTVPNVTGKTLAVAKTAIAHAGCAVGKVTHTASATVAKGAVISEKPKAGTHVDAGTKVALVVSKGK